MSSSGTTTRGMERNQERPARAPPDRVVKDDNSSDSETESESEVEPDTESDGESLISDASTLVEREEPVRENSAAGHGHARGTDEGGRPKWEKRLDQEDKRQDDVDGARVRSRRRELENERPSGTTHNDKRSIQEAEPETRTKSKSRRNPKPKPKEENSLSHKDYRERAYQAHGSYRRLPSTCCGCGCLDPIVEAWRKIWSKRIWRIAVRWLPYVLCIGFIGCAGVIGGSGPILGYYVFQLSTDSTATDGGGGGEYGAWGWCQSDGSDCTSPRPLYTGPSVSYFPSWFMPLLLAAMGSLAILHLLVLVYIFLFLRFPIQGYCGCVDLPTDPDLESQSQSKSKSKWSVRSRKIRSIYLFDVTLSLFTFLYAVIAAGVAWWVSVAHADTLWPYDLNIVLLVSPIIWLVTRAIYRSRWAYSSTLTEQRQRQKRTQSQRSSESYDAYKPKEVIPSTAGHKRPTRNVQSLD